MVTIVTDLPQILSLPCSPLARSFYIRIPKITLPVAQPLRPSLGRRYNVYGYQGLSYSTSKLVLASELYYKT
jgi:hypothetical protein